jgi:hypothetical protein
MIAAGTNSGGGVVADGLPEQSDKLKVVTVLPNLSLSAPMESRFVGILPASDSRVIQMAHRDPSVRALVDNFCDRHGARSTVSVLALDEDAPTGIKNLATLVSFRNVVAMSCILAGYQRAIGNPNVFWTLYSDYFDFFPFGPTKDGKELLHIGMALNCVESPKGFRGQLQPELPKMGRLMQAEPDETVFELLLSAWRKRFEKGRKDWASNRLFRSLATAYHAASLPKKNHFWFYDLGVNIALWVSAMEILVHPGRDGSADLPAVLNLLSKAKLERPILDKPRRITFRGQVQRTGGPGYCYWRLYRARNDFLHGNPVTPFSALFRPEGGQRVLTHIAPLVYNVALLCHFDYFEKSARSRLRAIRALDFSRMFVLSPLKKAFEHILSDSESEHSHLARGF